MNADKLAELREDAKREAYLEQQRDDQALRGIGRCLFCTLMSEVDNEFGLCTECWKRLALGDLVVCESCRQIVDGYYHCDLDGPLCKHCRCSHRVCVDMAETQ